MINEFLTSDGDREPRDMANVVSGYHSAVANNVAESGLRRMMSYDRP